VTGVVGVETSWQLVAELVVIHLGRATATGWQLVARLVVVLWRSGTATGWRLVAGKLSLLETGCRSVADQSLTGILTCSLGHPYAWTA
jgi:hypothetical protein